MVIPSRGRPANVARLLEAMAATCRGDTDLVIGLDEDDPDRDAYPKPKPDSRWQVEVRFGLRRVVPWINALAMPRLDGYEYIGHFGDDNVPRTIGWDVRIMEALELQPFAFANDLYPRAPGELACHIFTRSDVLRALGYFGPPSLQHMFVDNVWTDWGRACGIEYLDDVVVEHLHYTTGKSLLDRSYWESTRLMEEDRAAYEQYVSSGALAEDVKKIKGAQS